MTGGGCHAVCFAGGAQAGWVCESGMGQGGCAGAAGEEQDITRWVMQINAGLS